MNTTTMQLFALGDCNGIQYGALMRAHSAADAMARVFDGEQLNHYGLTSDRFDWPSFHATPVKIRAFSYEYLGPKVEFSDTPEGQARIEKLKKREVNPVTMHDAGIPDDARIGSQRVADAAVVEDNGRFQGVVANDAGGVFASPDDLDSLEAARAWISQAIDRE